MAIWGPKKYFWRFPYLIRGRGGAAIFSPPPLITAAAVSVVAITAICFEGKRKEAGKIPIFPSLIYGEKKGFAFKRKFSPFSRKRRGKNITAYFAYRRLFSSFFSGKRGSRLDFYPRKRRGGGGEEGELGSFFGPLLLLFLPLPSPLYMYVYTDPFPSTVAAGAVKNFFNEEKLLPYFPFFAYEKKTEFFHPLF